VGFLRGFSITESVHSREFEECHELLQRLVAVGLQLYHAWCCGDVTIDIGRSDLAALPDDGTLQNKLVLVMAPESSVPHGHDASIIQTTRRTGDGTRRDGVYPSAAKSGAAQHWAQLYSHLTWPLHAQSDPILTVLDACTTSMVLPEARFPRSRCRESCNRGTPARLGGMRRSWEAANSWRSALGLGQLKRSCVQLGLHWLLWRARRQPKTVAPGLGLAK
jgi:hypothetical protein